MTTKQTICSKREELEEAKRLARVLRYDVPALENKYAKYLKTSFYEQIELLKELQDLSIEVLQNQLNTLIKQCPHKNTWNWLDAPNNEWCDDCGETISSEKSINQSGWTLYSDGTRRYQDCGRRV